MCAYAYEECRLCGVCVHMLMKNVLCLNKCRHVSVTLYGCLCFVNVQYYKEYVFGVWVYYDLYCGYNTVCGLQCFVGL